MAGKMKTTAGELKRNFLHQFRCGYCDLQDMMVSDNPQFYTCGVYGWNFDAYCDWSRSVCVTTGYRGMFGKPIPEELLKRYSKRGLEIRERWSKSYLTGEVVDINEEMRNMLDDFYADLVVADLE